MVQLSLASLAALAGLATAAPSFFRPQPIQYATFTDTFDNETSVFLEGAFTRVGYQNNINYGQFQLDSPPITALETVMPVSAPNVAVVLPTTTLGSGTLSLNPQNTATKSGAIKYFDLNQFYFGCTTFTAQSLVGLPVGCGIEVSGYNTAGQMVGIASFNYAPAALVQAPLVKADLPATFVNLVNFTIAVATSAELVTDTTIVLDNVTHTNYW